MKTSGLIFTGFLMGRGLKAVFFDFDNTLVDSASVLPHAQRRVAGEIARFLNGSVDVDMVFSTVKHVERVLEMQGLYDRDRIWMHVLWELGFDGRVDDGLLRSWSLAYWEEFMKGEVFPETVEVLERLSKHYSLGVVTNTDGLYGMKRMRMEKKGLNRFFKVVVVAGEDIPEAKPSPRPFLLAAEMIDVKPSECVMVGDDPVNDVAGAKAAGMTAVLLDRSGGKTCPVKPDHVIKSLNQLLDLLPIWEGGQSF
uniref:HAD family hydrolase n=1 Tax=Caldiarchaeum subterraneum TaxID=311458 RepID=A0A7C5L8D0_CALS0